MVCTGVKCLKFLLENQSLDVILRDFGKFWRKLTSESQLRWLGPEKGVVHLASAAILNALWDLWGKLEGKPVWRLLSDMEPEVSVLIIRSFDLEEFIDLLHKYFPISNTTPV